MRMRGRKIIVGVSGSIAAYKSPLLVRELVRLDATVNVVMSAAAVQFVSPLVLQNLSRNPVIDNMFATSAQRDGSWHIDLARTADCMVIAPASARTLAALSYGLTDNALTCVAAALPSATRLIVAPAMDTEMWDHPATQENVARLKQRGSLIIQPGFGELASGAVGVGRLADIELIVEKLVAVMNDELISDTDTEDISAPSAVGHSESREHSNSPTTEDSQAWHHLSSIEPRSLHGKRVLITAGPTRERIDAVRYISNESTGKMGYAVAEAARDSGAEVILVCGPVAIPDPAGISTIHVESAAEMFAAVQKSWAHSDFIVATAAVADFRPRVPVNAKIKKTAHSAGLQLDLEPTIDILSWMGESKSASQRVVGFALESENHIENGTQKLLAKNCDMVVVNTASGPDRAIGSDFNKIILIQRDAHGTNHMQIPRLRKSVVARIIINAMAQLAHRGVNT